MFGTVGVGKHVVASVRPPTLPVGKRGVMSCVDTTPDYPVQPEAAVERAAADLPTVLQEMPNETGYGASAPAHGQRVVLAQRLVDELARRRGHARGAAAWALHRTVKSLQRGQKPLVLCFHDDGTGRGLRWEAIT